MVRTTCFWTAPGTCSISSLLSNFLNSELVQKSLSHMCVVAAEKRTCVWCRIRHLLNDI